MAQSLVERLEFTAKTSQDPVDAQALRDAAEAIELCIRALEFYRDVLDPNLLPGNGHDLGYKAQMTLKALADGRSRL